MRILFTGGGTAGHINPAIAIADYVKNKEPDTEVLFVGTKHGLEKNLVPKCGYNIEFIEVMGLKRSLSPENIKVFVNYIKSTEKSKKLLKTFKPDIVIGTGGYVCAPVIKAANKLKIPTIIHEQNVFPGLAIKMLSGKADVTAISFKETENMLKAKRMILTGNPLRPDLFEKKEVHPVRGIYGFDSKPVVLMFGGSLGAGKMNQALLEMLKEGIDKFNLIAATGERYYKEFENELNKEGINIKNSDNVRVVPYIYNMTELLGQADVIVGRAGAITVSEITALGKASVLIPSPNVAHNHQEYNARFLEKNGAARVVTEAELTGKRLIDEIVSIINHKDELGKMMQCSEKIGIKDACDTIYKCIKELIR